MDFVESKQANKAFVLIRPTSIQHQRHFRTKIVAEIRLNSASERVKKLVFFRKFKTMALKGM